MYNEIKKKSREEVRIFDEVKITVKAGKGGNGSCSFLREKFIDHGGPDGGDGGRGGNLIIEAKPNVNTLIKYRFKKLFIAEDGKGGSGKRRSGAQGADLVLNVPLGTQIFQDDGITLIHDFTVETPTFLIAKGGKGGLGNHHFKSSVNQAPRKTLPPEEGEMHVIYLKLKMICDIGLIGMPNSGKSSFLAAITNAKPKIANYAFTTLSPNLGIFEFNYKQVTIGDIPGLIEGASEGKGLGQKFLKHIERCKMLFHFIDISLDNFIQNYKAVRNEITKYDALNALNAKASRISEKKEFVILNKADLLTEKETLKKIKDFKKASGIEAIISSNFTRLNIPQIMEKAALEIDSLKNF